MLLRQFDTIAKELNETLGTIEHEWKQWEINDDMRKWKAELARELYQEKFIFIINSYGTTAV